jgi:hypothetical protein
MANLYGLDAVGNAAYVKATGAGSDSDPYLVHNDAFTDSLKSAFVSASGNIDVIAAAPGFKLRVLNMAITSAASGTVKLQSGGSSDKTPTFHLGVNGNVVMSNSLGVFESNAGEKINVVAAGTTDYTVMLTYREVAA